MTPIFKPKTRQELRQLILSEIQLHGTDCSLNHIDTSEIDDMGSLFERIMFNGDISDWNVSNVIDMGHMFSQSTFNGDLSKWNTSKCMNMRGMFSFSAFNQPIGHWDTSRVDNMQMMFQGSPCNQFLDPKHFIIPKRPYLCEDMLAGTPYSQDLAGYHLSEQMLSALFSYTLPLYLNTRACIEEHQALLLLVPDASQHKRRLVI